MGIINTIRNLFKPKPEDILTKWHESYGWDIGKVVTLVREDEDIFSIPLDKILEMREWCKNNCKGNFKIIAAYGFFEKDSDALLYKLIWR